MLRSFVIHPLNMPGQTDALGRQEKRLPRSHHVKSSVEWFIVIKTPVKLNSMDYDYQNAFHDRAYMVISRLLAIHYMFHQKLRHRELSFLIAVTDL